MKRRVYCAMTYPLWPCPCALMIPSPKKIGKRDKAAPKGKRALQASGKGKRTFGEMRRKKGRTPSLPVQLEDAQNSEGAFSPPSVRNARVYGPFEWAMMVVNVARDAAHEGKYDLKWIGGWCKKPLSHNDLRVRLFWSGLAGCVRILSGRLSMIITSYYDPP